MSSKWQRARDFGWVADSITRRAAEEAAERAERELRRVGWRIGDRVLVDATEWGLSRAWARVIEVLPGARLRVRLASGGELIVPGRICGGGRPGSTPRPESTKVETS